MLLNWLAWKLGKGSKIRLGKDPVVGLDTSYKLSEGLIKELNDRGIKRLCQFASYGNVNLIGTSWKSTTELNLQNHYKDWRNEYIWGLKHSGIQFVDREDKLVCLGYKVWSTFNSASL